MLQSEIRITDLIFLPDFFHRAWSNCFLDYKCIYFYQLCIHDLTMYLCSFDLLFLLLSLSRLNNTKLIQKSAPVVAACCYQLVSSSSVSNLYNTRGIYFKSRRISTKDLCLSLCPPSCSKGSIYRILDGISSAYNVIISARE